MNNNPLKKRSTIAAPKPAAPESKPVLTSKSGVPVKNPRTSGSIPPVGSRNPVPAKGVTAVPVAAPASAVPLGEPKKMLSAEKVILKSHEVEKLKKQIIELNKGYAELKQVSFFSRFLKRNIANVQNVQTGHNNNNKNVR